MRVSYAERFGASSGVDEPANMLAGVVGAGGAGVVGAGGAYSRVDDDRIEVRIRRA
jgi:hypothetical protein